MVLGEEKRGEERRGRERKGEERRRGEGRGEERRRGERKGGWGILWGRRVLRLGAA